MPVQALALALAASIYPPAVAAVIALGRGVQVRSRVFAFVSAAAIVTYATGTLMLIVLEEVGATGTRELSAGAAVDLALGVVLVGLAAHLYRSRPAKDAQPSASASTSKIQRYLESRRLAFVLGITLYVLPSPIYVAAVKSIADAKLSTSAELLALAVTVVTMLWLILVPMVMLLAFPEPASRALQSINEWFSRNGRMVAIVASAGAGLYLAIRGLIDLIG